MNGYKYCGTNPGVVVGDEYLVTEPSIVVSGDVFESLQEWLKFILYIAKAISAELTSSPSPSLPFVVLPLIESSLLPTSSLS